MNTAATASPNARETTKDAREATGKVRNAASEAAGDLESDLQALRDDFRRLAEQMADVVAKTGNTAWRHAKSGLKSGLGEAAADAQGKGREAASAVREVSDHFVAALDESIKTRPYATLALAAGLAFLFGATWRR